ncbi:tyrosine-type recombinase/integrase [Anaerovibrio sp. JC8]|uniref:tyrosine-type recombinase/integrase n=1 Tax=Anaerovibrio sp. JC8 TaxID=1240085 RepID=UPI000A12075E|nr:tyrosine-type recombinase/integrase [Anaerovibrio sp. JC8]
MHILTLTTGTINQRKDRRYVGQFVITYADGCKERKTVTDMSRKKCLAKMKKLKEEILLQATEHSEDKPVKDMRKSGAYKASYIYYLLNDWMEEKKHIEGLEEHTLWSHEQRIKHDLKPWFGNLKAKEITTQNIIQLYEYLSKERNLSAETIHKIGAVINNSFKKLCRDGIVAVNPTEHIKLPKIVVEEKKPLTQEEIKLLLDTAKEYNERPTTQTKNIYMFLRLAIVSGCRRGELCGLHWQEVDFKNNTINIKYSLEESGSGKCRLKAPKTDKPRVIAIPADVMQELKEFKKYSSGSVVFRSKLDPDKPQAPSNISRAFEKVRQLADLSHITIHLLRHTHLSILAQNNVDIRTIAQRAGHHNIQTTMRYIHSNSELDQQAAALFSNL